MAEEAPGKDGRFIALGQDELVLPVVPAETSVSLAMSMAASLRLPGIVLADDEHLRMVTVETLIEAFNARRPLRGLPHASLAAKDVEMFPARGHVMLRSFNKYRMNRIGPPLWACPKGDEFSVGPGTCSTHRVPYEAV